MLPRAITVGPWGAQNTRSGWATLRLPERSQSEADALASDRTHPLSLSDARYCAGHRPTRLPESGATRRTQRKAPGAHSPLGLRGSTQHLARSGWIERSGGVVWIGSQRKRRYGSPSCWLKGRRRGGCIRRCTGHVMRSTGSLRRCSGPRDPNQRVPHCGCRLYEREEISRGLASGESLRGIARRLGRAPSTISREVKANHGVGRYRAVVPTSGPGAKPSAPSRPSWRGAPGSVTRSRPSSKCAGHRSRSRVGWSRSIPRTRRCG